eukprot:274767_1
MAEAENLELWLKSNKLSELLPTLTENDVAELSDLKESIEEEDEIGEFMETLNVPSVLESKFKTALLALIGIGNVEETQNQGLVNNISEKMDQKNEQDTAAESDDDCFQEAFINPSNKERLQPIWNSDNATMDIIKCIGSLRIEFDVKDKLTQREFLHGTGTVIHIDENNRCHILTAAHNGYQLLRECPECGKKTISFNCKKCDRKCQRVKPLELIQATSITFYRRCIVQKRIDPSTGVEKVFGDPISSYYVNNYFIHHSLYQQYATPKSGYDICIMTCQCTDVKDAAMYKEICSKIKLVCDPTFGSQRNRLSIFGYPGNKGYVDKNSNKMMHQMYGMSTGINGNHIKVKTHDHTKKM